MPLNKTQLGIRSLTYCYFNLFSDEICYLKTFLIFFLDDDFFTIVQSMIVSRDGRAPAEKELRSRSLA